MKERVKAILVGCVLAVAAARAGGQEEMTAAQVANMQCMTCHGLEDAAGWSPAERREKVKPVAGAPAPKSRPGLYIEPGIPEGHPHAKLACTDCHPKALTLPHPQVQGPAVCATGTCHVKAEATYRRSYHGKANGLGSDRVARCASCHAGAGPHQIFAMKDARNSLTPQNRLATCRKCHEKAQKGYLEFQAHADAADAKTFPVLYAIRRDFLIVMCGALGFFGLHSLLWLVRSLLERRRAGIVVRASGLHPETPGPAGEAGGAIVRFAPVERICHGVLIVCFFGLALTGLPLACAGEGWSRGLAGFWGGPHAAGAWHRGFASGLMALLLVHAGVLIARAIRGGAGRMLRGPSTLLPRVKDAADAAGMFRWFVGLGERPAIDRWAYWEKFDYLAALLGSLIVGASGLLLWFPQWFSGFLPGWWFNVATVVHGYEALLAVGFIFTIHFFNAHLRPESFPANEVIFTGRVREEAWRRERPAQAAREEAAGGLVALRRPAAGRAWRVGATAVGLAAMAAGVTVVVLIVRAWLKG